MEQQEILRREDLLWSWKYCEERTSGSAAGNIGKREPVVGQQGIL